MENLFLEAIVREIAPQLLGRTVARLHLQNGDLLFDFRLGGDRLLIASPAPATCALYIGRPASRPGDKEPPATHPFLMLARKHIGNARLIELRKDPLDRLVRLRFEKFDAAGDRVQAGLTLALTGRMANACLLDDQGHVTARLADRGPFAIGEPIPFHEETSLGSFLAPVPDGTTAEEILAQPFGGRSPLDPLAKSEFLFRLNEESPAEAFNSLVEDLSRRPATPLVYARYPLEDFGERPVKLKADLRLAHFELRQASYLKAHRYATLSEAAEQYYAARARALAFDHLRGATTRWLKDEIKKREQLFEAVAADRRKYEDPDRLKRFGDLLLANLATLERQGGHARVVDYFDPEQAEIMIPIEESATIQQAAAAYFARYQKARRALDAIAARENQLRPQLDDLKRLLERLEAEPTRLNVLEVREVAARHLGRKPAREVPAAERPARAARKSGRRFISSDGYEILVGRNDRENDEITFRVAGSLDVWLHAADYPGSHVVIRNPKRGEIPHRTLVEAAQVAAFYSQAASLDKVSVHYTQRKFISKPPRAKAGLVRLSSLKTILVEPKISVERLA